MVEGLKSRMYYLRTKPKANVQQFTIDPTKSKTNYKTEETMKYVKVVQHKNI